MNRYRLVLALGVVFVSSAAILIRLTEAHPLVIAAYRLCITSLIIAPISLTFARREIRQLSLSKFLLAVSSGACLALHFGLWITSLGDTSVASSVVLVTSSPIFVALVSYWLFKERLSRLSITGIIVCIAGAIIIGYVNWQGGAIPLLGAVLAFTGAIAVSGYMLIGRILRQSMGLLTYIFLTYTSAGIILLAAAMLIRQPLTGYSGNTYLMLILLAVVPQVLGHSSINWSLRFLSATEITVAILGEPVIAIIMAFFILKEPLSIWEIAGGIIILVGIYLAMYRPPGRKIDKPLEFIDA